MCDSLQSHHQTRLNSNFPQHVFSQTHVVCCVLRIHLRSGQCASNIVVILLCAFWFFIKHYNTPLNRYLLEVLKICTTFRELLKIKSDTTQLHLQLCFWWGGRVISTVDSQQGFLVPAPLGKLASSWGPKTWILGELMILNWSHMQGS